jgi:hypothetical protein
VSKEQEVYERLDALIVEWYVRPLVTPELVEEHRRNPLGHHSDALERVLRYVRRSRGRLEGAYVIVALEPYRSFAIGTLSAQRGVSPAIDRSEIFASREEAEHAVFVRRLRDLGLTR